MEVESVPSSSTTSTALISTDADVSSEGSSDESEDTTQTIALADWDNWFVDKHDHGNQFVMISSIVHLMYLNHMFLYCAVG